MSPMNPRLLRPLATGFNPRSISGLAGWWDAADASSVTLNSTTVSQWDDKSGNGRHAVQATAIDQPAYTQQINGRNVLTFAGSEYLTAVFALTQPATYFAVCRSGKTTGGATDRSYVFDGGNPGVFTSIDRHLLALYGNNSGNISAWAGAWLESSVAISTSPVMASVVVNGASSLLAIDGAAAVSGNIGTNDLPLGLTFGGAYRNDTDLLTGDIAEIIVYDRALSAAERQRVERYLGRRWGITVA